MEPGERVVVVGAGIAGLTAALSFARAGFGVDLFERATTFDEAGAGIQLSPNSLRVLARLGLSDDLARTGISAERVTLRAGTSGRAIAEVPVRSSDGTAYLSIRRADLQAALLAAVARTPDITVTLGAECTRIDRDGEACLLLFSGVSPFQRSARIVVAADGVRSRIADTLGHPAAGISGDVAWRMTVRGESDGRDDASLKSPTGIEAWLGPARHAVAYPVRRGLDTNLVLIGRAKDVSSDPAGEIDKADLHRYFAGWDRALHRLIDAAGPATAWPLLTSDRRRRIGDPPGLLLLGDAAHAMLPYAAQGAAMAIEDGWVAAIAFRNADGIEAAVARFEAERAPRLARVRSRVAFHRRVYHLPPPLSAARDLALRLRSPDALARDLAWLYDWVPPEH